MRMQNGRKMNYQIMIVLAIVVGVCCIAIQFMPGWESLSFMLSVAVLGGLIGGNDGYAEQDRQQLERSYKTAFEWLLLIALTAYAFVELSKWLHLEGATVFVNGHWPGFLLAVMCALMGLAGFQKRSYAQ